MGIKDLNPFNKEKDGDNKHFVCVWCGKEFNSFVRTSSSEGKHGSVSNQVRCPGCKGFLKSNSGVDA